MPKDNITLKYDVPIIESDVQEGLSSDEMNITGVAISETTTSNGHKFIGDELSEAASTLKDVVVLKDHENMVDNIVGRVTASSYNVLDKNISFKAKIMDKSIKDMIKDGRLNTVSVGASVEKLEETEDGLFIPRGIIFKELSVVAIPADSSASFSIGLKDSLDKDKNIKEKVNNAVKSAMENYIVESQSQLKEKPLKGGLIRMAENDETKEEPKEEVAPAEAPKAEAEVAEPKEESKEESKEEAVEAKLKKVKLALKEKELAKLEKELADAEEPASEVKKEEPKEDEPEAEAPVETTEGYSISNITEGVKGNAMTLVRESY